MENTTDVNVKKSRIVRITFTAGVATVNVNDSDESKDFDIRNFSDEIVQELLQYGWKQKVSDYRASDKLRGSDKLDAIAECHEMLINGEFRQKRESSAVPIAEQIIAFGNLSDDQKEAIKLVSPNLYARLNK